MKRLWLAGAVLAAASAPWAAEAQIAGLTPAEICRSGTSRDGSMRHVADVVIGACNQVIANRAFTGTSEAEAHRRRGDGWLDAGLPLEASRDYERALMLVPNYDEALAGRARAASALGQHAAALRDADQLVARGRDYESLGLRCEVRLHAGQNLELAQQDCDAAVQMVPQDLDTRELRMLVLMRRGDWAGARRDWAMLTRSEPNSPFAAFAGALIARQEGDRASEVAMVGKTPVQLRETVRRRFGRAGLPGEYKEHPNFIAFQSAVADYPAVTAATANQVYGECVRGSTSGLKQVAACTQLIRWGGVQPSQQLGDTLLVQQAVLGSAGLGTLEALSLGMQLNPNSAFGLMLTAQLISAFAPTDALATIERAISADPSLVEAKASKADIQMLLDDRSGALATLRAAIVEHPARGELLHKRASLYEDTGDYDLGIPDLTAAIALEPDNAEYLNGRCWQRGLANRDLQAGLADCEKALVASPGAWHIIDSRALIKLRLGDLPGARADYQKASEIGDASSLYGLGVVKLRMGDVQAGRADIAAALAKDPEAGDVFARIGLAPAA